MESSLIKSKVEVAQLCQTLCHPMDYTDHGILQARILEWVAFLFSSLSLLNLSNPGIEPSFPTLRADSLPAEPPGKPKNTGQGSLSLLQQIFPTEESNQGLLQGRQMILGRECKKMCLDDELGLFEEVWVTHENREVARNIPRKIL